MLRQEFLIFTCLSTFQASLEQEVFELGRFLRPGGLLVGMMRLVEL